MKKIIILFMLLYAGSLYGQNNAIFYGGVGDGWNMGSYMQVSNATINHGGTGDGWNMGSYMQASNTTINHGSIGDGWNKGSYLQAFNAVINHGGNGDGWNTNSYMQLASNLTINHGGNGDGWSLNNFFPNTTTPSHYGGDGDGWAQNNHMPVVSQTLYKGGQGDGWASNVIPLGPLPVELLSFNGKEFNDTHILDWVTSMELNSSHFVVEHSANANYFSELGMVTAAGNSSVESKYTFTNKKPVPGNNYYRLKMVDLDEKYKYSNVILLKLLKDNTSMVIYPNPAANILNMELNGIALNTKMQIDVMDASGKLLKSEEYITDNQKYTLDVSSFANGLYFLKINGSSFSEIVKFSISK